MNGCLLPSIKNDFQILQFQVIIDVNANSCDLSQCSYPFHLRVRRDETHSLLRRDADIKLVLKGLCNARNFLLHQLNRSHFNSRKKAKWFPTTLRRIETGLLPNMFDDYSLTCCFHIYSLNIFKINSMSFNFTFFLQDETEFHLLFVYCT